MIFVIQLLFVLIIRYLFLHNQLYFIAINIINFFVFGYDKLMSRNKFNRISEKLLLINFLLGGWIGGSIGMILFNHKISKISFLWKAIVVIIINIAILYFENST